MRRLTAEANYYLTDPTLGVGYTFCDIFYAKNLLLGGTIRLEIKRNKFSKFFFKERNVRISIRDRLQMHGLKFIVER